MNKIDGAREFGEKGCKCDQCGRVRALVALADAVIADGDLSSCLVLYRGQSREARKPYWGEYYGRIATALEGLL